MKNLLLLLTLFVIQSTNAQAPTAIWQKCYGGTSDDYIDAFSLSTPDGGYMIGLQTSSNDGDISGNHGNLDISLMKINATGIVQWQKCYGGSDIEHITSLIQTADGGYLIVGDTFSNNGDVSRNHGVIDLWVIKINAIGTIQWQKCYGGDGSDYLENIIQTSDGGYIGVGYTTSINNADVLGNTSAGAWVIKINDLGVIQWQKVYDTDSENSRFSRILQNSDGGYVVAGFTQLASFPGFHGGFVDIVVAKMNQTGTIQWQKCYGGSGAEDGLHALVATNDGGYIFSSQTESNDGDVSGNHGNSDCWLVKLDASGTILGQNCYGGSGGEGGGYILKTLDGGMVMSVGTNSNDGNVSGNHGGYDAWTIKFSATGVIQWQKCFGGTGNDGGVIFQLTDGTYMVVGGGTYSNNGDISGNHDATTSDGFLIKLTAENLSTENFANKDIKYYPNPMQNILHIDIEKEFSGKIMDLTGKTLMNVTSKDIDVSSLSAGIYLLDIVSDGKRFTKKIIKE
ncbi:T9SS type A sorting domain-containing protein [Flavobacterium luteum]|uniref:T9SS type A sorting domain-containing protein n=1 Tax=Flavobacterium luteum TaxID=2026654 RepID=A0A7J5AH33_9FLAO|nr:T9SS type A sorting domain-containing protein [Flavobacterium luteum]KAB1156911.1 T9SS type A sorting domain-containing protein [Flavobacterium luteum]